MARIVTQKLVKQFGHTTAVDGLDLDIADREFLAIVGPSGCGKSSTLRMISGLEQPSSGRILFGDTDVTSLPADKRDVAMVFQNYALYPHMDVRHNLAFPLENMGLPRSEIDARVMKAASMLGIVDLLTRRPRQLSGGQRQRVALGRAVVRDAAVFLFDEPLSNLDAKLRVVMRSELKKLHGEIGQTFIYVTHDQAEAMTMADRIAVMAGGRLQQLGTPDEIYFRPANRFVAGFIGTPAMNFLSGRITREAGRPVFELAAGGRKAPLAGDLAAAGECVLGVRPEGVALVGAGQGELSGTVELIEPLHPDVFVTVRVGAESVVARTSSETRVRTGEPVGLRLLPEALHVFAASGERIEAVRSSAPLQPAM